MPPPSVRPEMPTLPVSPNGVASPWARGRDRVLAGGQAGLRPGEATLGVDVQALHAAQVEDDPALARAVAGQAVRCRRGPRARGPASRAKSTVRATSAALAAWTISAGRRSNVRVVDEAGDVVALVLGPDDGAGEPGGEAGDVERARGVDGRGCGRGPSRSVSFRCAWGRRGGDGAHARARDRRAATAGNCPRPDGRRMASRDATDDDVGAPRLTGARPASQPGGGDTPWR